MGRFLKLSDVFAAGHDVQTARTISNSRRIARIGSIFDDLLTKLLVSTQFMFSKNIPRRCFRRGRSPLPPLFEYLSLPQSSIEIELSRQETRDQISLSLIFHKISYYLVRALNKTSILSNGVSVFRSRRRLPRRLHRRPWWWRLPLLCSLEKRRHASFT